LDEGVVAKQELVDWQGNGPGRVMSGPGSVAATEVCEMRACVLAGASDAEARPAMATNKAKNRMTVFIFGNLSDLILKGEISPFQA
jgi:hypothetical protein